MSDVAPATTTTGATTTTTATTTTAPPKLTHLDEAGRARMVDVSGKDVTVRTASASGRVLLSPQAVAALRDGTVPKGDALAVARIAGIQGAKRTPDLIPLCHPLGLHGVAVDLTVADDGVDITATVKTADRTGVEMEALTSVSVAALTLIDMIKAVDKAAVVTDVRIDAKEGGKSGPWRRPADGRLSHEPADARIPGERQADGSRAGDRAEGEPS
jgi:cyclic pyranopterin monophosphate synthase